MDPKGSKTGPGLVLDPYRTNEVQGVYMEPFETAYPPHRAPQQQPMQVLEGGSNVFFPLGSSNQHNLKLVDCKLMFLQSVGHSVYHSVAVLTCALHISSWIAFITYQTLAVSSAATTNQTMA